MQAKPLFFRSVTIFALFSITFKQGVIGYSFSHNHSVQVPDFEMHHFSQYLMQTEPEGGYKTAMYFVNWQASPSSSCVLECMRQRM